MIEFTNLFPQNKLFGVRRLDAALVRRGWTPVFEKLNPTSGRDRSRPAKAASSRRTPNDLTRSKNKTRCRNQSSWQRVSLKRFVRLR
jgi:hypothetical protein